MKDIKDTLRKVNENNFNKMVNERAKQKKDERILFYLIFGVTGFSILFNNIAPLITIFIIFYFEVNRDKLLRI